jgi:hypothetical protein
VRVLLAFLFRLALEKRPLDRRATDGDKNRPLRRADRLPRQKPQGSLVADAPLKPVQLLRRIPDGHVTA